MSAILTLVSSAAGQSLRGSEPLRLPSRPDQRPQIAIVIDDLGLDWSRFDTVNALPVPLTLAVLPYGQEAQAMVDAAERRHEVILHMPMEPHRRKEDAGPHMVRPAGDAAIREAMTKNFAKLTGYRGVSNHTGSRLTADRRAMRSVLTELAARDLYFLDNKTSPRSKAAKLAGETGARVLEADLFLDGDFGSGGTAHVTRQLDRAAAIARKQGHAIVIGHPYPTTVSAIESWSKDQKTAIRFIRTGDLIKSATAEADS